MTEQDQYAPVAATASKVEQFAMRKFAEFPTLMQQLGQITGANVLDLACGTGSHSRLLASQGARRVVGVDVSDAMVDQARRETPDDAPIEYIVADAASMSDEGVFDVVNAGFLFNYAADFNQLSAMCSSIAKHLRPGGRFVGEVPNPDQDFLDGQVPNERYGVRYVPNEERASEGQLMRDGDPYKLVISGLPSALTIYYWTTEMYRQALQESGIEDIVFVPFRPTQQAIEELGLDFWQPLLDNPLGLVVAGRKPA